MHCRHRVLGARVHVALQVGMGPMGTPSFSMQHGILEGAVLKDKEFLSEERDAQRVLWRW